MLSSAHAQFPFNFTAHLVTANCVTSFKSRFDSFFLSVPYGVRIGQLDKSHVDYVCDNWPLYTADYRPVVEKMIELNPSVGVFVRTEGGGEELASMVLQSEYGGLGLLQTLPKYRERGYAALVLAYLSEVMRQLGYTTHGHTKVGNMRAQKLFRRIGFKFADRTNWITLEST